MAEPECGKLRSSSLSHWFGRLCIVAALAVVTVLAPAHAEASIQVYWDHGNIPAGQSRYGVQHNHYYNEMIVNNQGFLTNIHEETYCCGWKWGLSGIGSIWYSHADTWYAYPVCHNRDSFSYWVVWCDAEW
jgi:hypothetical protein